MFVLNCLVQVIKLTSKRIVTHGNCLGNTLWSFSLFLVEMCSSVERITTSKNDAWIAEVQESGARRAGDLGADVGMNWKR